MDTQSGSGLTKGEAILQGLEQIREGLSIVSQASRETDLVRTLVGSARASQQLREIMSGGLLRTIVIEMVSSRNRKLASETVEKVISDYHKVLFDLSRPFEPPAPPKSDNHGVKS